MAQQKRDDVDRERESAHTRIGFGGSASNVSDGQLRVDIEAGRAPVESEQLGQSSAGANEKSNERRHERPLARPYSRPAAAASRLSPFDDGQAPLAPSRRGREDNPCRQGIQQAPHVGVAQHGAERGDRDARDRQAPSCRAASSPSASAWRVRPSIASHGKLAESDACAGVARLENVEG